MIDLALFKIPAFTASLMVNLAGRLLHLRHFPVPEPSSCSWSSGLTPLKAALWSVPSSLVFTVMSFQAWRVTNRLGPVRTVLWDWSSMRSARA